MNKVLLALMLSLLLIGCGGKTHSTVKVDIIKVLSSHKSNNSEYLLDNEYNIYMLHWSSMINFQLGQLVEKLEHRNAVPMQLYLKEDIVRDMREVQLNGEDD